MTDKNGIQLKTGQIVKVEGGYFKADNGYFVVKHSPADENWMGNDYSLRKCTKKGVESIAKYSTAFWPLMVTTNSFEKRCLARTHNKTHATIEVVDQATVYKVKIIENFYGTIRESIRVILQKEYDELSNSKYLTFELI